VRIQNVLWDLDSELEGNVQHIAEHGITIEEVEEVLFGSDDVAASNTSGRPIMFGETSTGRYIAVDF